MNFATLIMTSFLEAPLTAIVTITPGFLVLFFSQNFNFDELMKNLSTLNFSHNAILNVPYLCMGHQYFLLTDFRAKFSNLTKKIDRVGISAGCSEMTYIS